MKTINQLLSAIVLTLLLFSTTTILAQDDAPKSQEFMTVTTNHWNMDKEDFKMSEWKAAAKEYHEKVTMKNEYIMGASFYLHNMTADNTEFLTVQNFASWEDMGKFGERNGELEKEAWPDEAERKAFLKNLSSYYANEHSDEIYAPIEGAKHMTEKPTKDMVCYVRKSHFAFPEDGTMEEFNKLRMEGNAGIVQKNEYVKAYYPNVHAWGSDKTEYIEAFFLDSIADLDKMFDRGDELMKEAFPDTEENKAKGKAWRSYFTGVHGDYLYTWIHDLGK
ncbi:hypothetical protein [uncultured Algibacter sp.]|uniref:hypothetical protein n=1 Tax=uncultured Algibacter sp. TaxID=298659 RepID=UPI002634297F|nr:hypothetical protein [uncultured Algibacter sp.]